MQKSYQAYIDNCVTPELSWGTTQNMHIKLVPTDSIGDSNLCRDTMRFKTCALQVPSQLEEVCGQDETRIFT